MNLWMPFPADGTEVIELMARRAATASAAGLSRDRAACGAEEHHDPLILVSGSFHGPLALSR